MGLWLEHRDEKGNLIDRGQFFGGQVVMPLMGAGDGTEAALTLTLKQAQELAKMSNGLPAEKRDWVLRVKFSD